MTKDKYPYIALAFGLVAVSTASVLVKLSDAPSSIIAAYRIFFTVVILGIPTLIFKRKELAKVTKRELSYSFLSGTFLAFHFITWFESLKYTSVASSVVLVTLQPVFAMLGTYLFFKETVSIKEIFGALLAFSGSVVIGWGDFKIGGMALYGDILALTGAIFVTGYWLVGQSLRKTLSLLPYTFLVYGASAIVLFGYNIALGIELFAYEMDHWLIFIALAIIPTVFGHTIFNWALKYVNTTTVSVTILGEPIGATLLAFYILNEMVTTTQLLGGLVILTGIFIYLKYNKTEKSTGDIIAKEQIEF